MKTERWLKPRMRIRVRQIARDSLIEASYSESYPMHKEPQIKRKAIRMVREKLSKEEGFGGIFASILIAIAVRIAIRLIEDWIDKNLFDQSIPAEYQEGEFGYVA